MYNNAEKVDITWPRGDTKFLFECRSERSERVKYF